MTGDGSGLHQIHRPSAVTLPALHVVFHVGPHVFLISRLFRQVSVGIDSVRRFRWTLGPGPWPQFLNSSLCAGWVLRSGSVSARVRPAARSSARGVCSRQVCGPTSPVPVHREAGAPRRSRAARTAGEPPTAHPATINPDPYLAAASPTRSPDLGATLLGALPPTHEKQTASRDVRPRAGVACGPARAAARSAPLVT